MFSNPDNVFPRRVVYRPPEGEMFHARIEGDGSAEDGSEIEVIRFSYRRIDCAALWDSGVPLPALD